MLGASGGRKTSRLVTVGGPVGLLLGVLAGWLAHSGTVPWIGGLLPYVEPVGRLWLNALRVAVVPLIVCLLVTGVCGFPRQNGAGRWGARTFGWIVALLLGGALVSVLVSNVYFAIHPPAPLLLTDASAPAPAPVPVGHWTEELLPANLFAAAAEGDVLPLAVLAALFGLALRALPDDRRKPVESLFVGVRDTVMVLIRWVMLAVPVGAFALMFEATLSSGFAAAGSILHFVAYVSALLCAVALVLAFLAAVVARRGLAKALAALSPLIAVAVGTRSSIASLPTLVQSADQLGLPATAKDVVLPACISLFKMNRPISSTAKMLFMASALDVAVGPHAVLAFVGTVVLLSFATPGLPAGGSNVTWGAYLAAGIPLEAVVIFEAADVPTDFAKTALNVIADFAVAVFASARIAP